MGVIILLVGPSNTCKKKEKMSTLDRENRKHLIMN